MHFLRAHCHSSYHTLQVVLKLYIYIRSLEQRYHISLLRLIAWILLEFVYIIKLVMFQHTLGGKWATNSKTFDVHYNMFR